MEKGDDDDRFRLEYKVVQFAKITYLVQVIKDTAEEPQVESIVFLFRLKILFKRQNPTMMILQKPNIRAGTICRDCISC